MAEQRASGGLQAARVGMALVFLGVAVWCAVTGQWFVAVVMLAGVGGAVASFRRGTWDREAARDYAVPRLVGGAIALVVVVVVALTVSLLA